MRTRLLILSIAIAAFTANSVRAQDADSAKTFVQSLYKWYTRESKGVPSSGPHARLYYHSSLLALMRADERAVGPGNVGAIDADPVCGCQDWDGIWNLHVDLRLQSPDRAIAHILFAVFEPKGGSSDNLNHLQMTLAPENGQWRIWDVRDESDPKNIFDVRDALQLEIRQLAKPAKKIPKQ